MKLETHAFRERLVPFMVATPFHVPFLNRSPFGLDTPDTSIFNPLSKRSESFLLLLQNLDARTFGPEGMPMPRWVFYDCSEIPGAIYGFGLPSHAISDDLKAVLEVPADYAGLVPLSMYIAIPMATDGHWFGHNLCSISPSVPGEGLKGLGSYTKALAIAAFQTRVLHGATQWDSTALYIHTKFGPLDLETAYTPAHSESFTLTYSFEVSESGLRNAGGESGIEIARPKPQNFLHRSDESEIIALQDAIEAGQNFCIPCRPLPSGQGGFHVPICHLPSE